MIQCETLIGIVQPLYGLIPGPATYKIWFNSGGCSKFLKAYHAIVDKLRSSMRAGVAPSSYMPHFGSGNFQEQFMAYADSNDPTVLYVSQPPVAPQPQPMQTYISGGPVAAGGIPMGAPVGAPYMGPAVAPGGYQPAPGYAPGPSPASMYVAPSQPMYQPPRPMPQQPVPPEQK